MHLPLHPYRDNFYAFPARNPVQVKVWRGYYRNFETGSSKRTKLAAEQDVRT
jgi:hypothetical protein